MSYFNQWCVAFIVTCLLEVPIYIYLLKDFVGGKGRAASIALLVNVLSHPILWFVVPAFSPYAVWLFCAEIGVTVFECIVILIVCRMILRRHFPWYEGLRAAVIANVFSTLIGLLIFN